MSCAPILVAFIVVPLLFTGVTYKLKGSGGGGRQGASAFQNAPVPPKMGESKLIDELTRKITGTEVAYAPANALTRRVIQMLSSRLPPGNNQWSAYKSEREIQNAALRKTKGAGIRVAIVFEDGFTEDGGVMKPVGGSTISYKLRHEAEEPSSLFLFPPALSLFSSASASKLLGLEILLDKIIIAQLANQNQLPNDTITVQQFPSQRLGSRRARKIGCGKSEGKEWKETSGGSGAGGGAFVILLMICFCTIVPGVMREVVDEKASGVKELMRMMGLRSWMHWSAWMIHSLLTLLLPIKVIALLLSCPIHVKDHDEPFYLKYVDWSLYWFLLFSYAVAGTSFAFFVSTFFQRPMYAIATGIALWILTSIIPLAFHSDYEQMSFVTKFSICLVPNFAFFFADAIIDSYALDTVGASWRDLYSGMEGDDDPLTLGLITAAMYLSAALYSILAVYFENILPSEFGVRKPFYYPFMPSTWCDGKVGPQKPDSENVEKTSDDGGNFEEDPTEIQIGVEIKNLRKVFGFRSSKKVAVADLTLNMYHGQITALLGHNGAGKTTAMSMPVSDRTKGNLPFSFTTGNPVAKTKNVWARRRLIHFSCSRNRPQFMSFHEAK